MKKKKSRSFTSDLLNFVIVFLVMVILALGILIIRPSGFLNGKTPSVSPTLSVDSTLTPPPPGATEEQNSRFYQAAMKAAKRADYLEVSHCEGHPKIIQVNNDSQLIVKNSGKADRRIRLFETEYFIGSQTQQEIPIHVENTPSIYGIGCDSADDRNLGLIVILPNE